MTRDQIEGEYFRWLCDTISLCRVSKIRPFTKLLSHLHRIEFTYSLEMDANRADDGIRLRYRFGSIYKYSDSVISNYLDTMPCSILEMMVALSLGCEEHIMKDHELGDRTGEWFWGMINNLRLGTMTNSTYNNDRVEDTIQKLMDRDYGYYGEGGLFTISNTRRDLRDVDIWYQMCWYLNTIL